MKTLGPLYVGKLKYYHRHFLPIVEVGTTRETEYPFRKGKCLVFRAPWTIPGVYVGVFITGKKPWGEYTDEDIDEMLLEVIKGRLARYNSGGILVDYTAEDDQ